MKKLLVMVLLSASPIAFGMELDPPVGPNLYLTAVPTATATQITSQILHQYPSPPAPPNSLNTYPASHPSNTFNSQISRENVQELADAADLGCLAMCIINHCTNQQGIPDNCGMCTITCCALCMLGDAVKLAALADEGFVACAP